MSQEEYARWHYFLASRDPSVRAEQRPHVALTTGLPSPSWSRPRKLTHPSCFQAERCGRPPRVCVLTALVPRSGCGRRLPRPHPPPGSTSRDWRQGRCLSTERPLGRQAADFFPGARCGRSSHQSSTRILRGGDVAGVGRADVPTVAASRVSCSQLPVALNVHFLVRDAVTVSLTGGPVHAFCLRCPVMPSSAQQRER